MKKINSTRENKQTLHRGQGFSLIELMIAILIGFLITLALVAVYLNISRTNREMAKTNSQIENARFALQILKDDVIHAGFWGGFLPQFDDLTVSDVPGDTPSAVPPPCAAYDATTWDAGYINNIMGIVVQSYDARPATCSSLLPNYKANTDILIVRHADTCLAGTAGCEAVTPGKLYLQVSDCSTELDAGNRYRIAQKSATNPDPVFSLKDKRCSISYLAGLRKYTSSIYYVRDYARTAGDGIPTLMRAQFDGTAPGYQAAVPLVEGIESFLVEFGVDNKSKTGASVDYSSAITWQDSSNLVSPTNRGDGSPDGAFIRCTTSAPCSAATLMDVVSVKLHILARAENISPEYYDTKTYALGSSSTGPFNDKFKRHVFSTAVRINNVSGWRETP